MLDYLYQKRLKQDLERWVDTGWLSSESASKILDELDVGDGQSRLPMALAGIGVVCVALALTAFIAANWDGIPRYSKLAGIAVLVLGANGLAAFCSAKGKKGLADLATAFASLTFIGGMALVGQIFHLPADWVGGGLLVAIGGLAAAWLAGSKASLVIGAVGALVWQSMRPDQSESLLLANLVGFVLLVAVLVHAARHPFVLGRWCAVLLLLSSFGRMVIDFGRYPNQGDDLFLGLMIAGFAGLAAIMVQVPAIVDMAIKWSSSYPKRQLGHWLLMANMQNTGVLLLAGLTVFSLLFGSDLEVVSWATLLPSSPITAACVLALITSVVGAILSFKTSKSLALFGVVTFVFFAAVLPIGGQNLILMSALSLSASIALVVLGVLYRKSEWSFCGYLALTVIAIWLLYETVGSLLGQALFFLVAGLVLLAIAFLAVRLKRRFGQVPVRPKGSEAVQ